MNRDLLMGAFALLPLFALFAIFLAALYFRSRYNMAHPEAQATPAQRLRHKIIEWTLYALAVAIGLYVIFHADRFTPSWTDTLFVGFAGFLLGEWVGQRNALRRLEGDRPPSPPEPP
jgi:hypothetical protein